MLCFFVNKTAQQSNFHKKTIVIFDPFKYARGYIKKKSFQYLLRYMNVYGKEFFVNKQYKLSRLKDVRNNWKSKFIATNEKKRLEHQFSYRK